MFTAPGRRVGAAWGDAHGIPAWIALNPPVLLKRKHGKQCYLGQATKGKELFSPSAKALC